MRYSVTREPVQKPQTPMFNRQAHSRPFKWKQMLDFWCIGDLKCSKTSKLAQHARSVSRFQDVLLIPPSIIKASKWCTRNLEKMEVAWMIQTASSFQGHSCFVDRWSHCVCAFIKMIADQLVGCSNWANEFDSSSHRSVSVFRWNIYHTLIGKEILMH